MAGKAFFFQRMNDHVQYLRKIEETLSGQGDFQGCDHKSCALGKWLCSSGLEEAASVSEEAKAMFDKLLEPHERFHHVSKEALEKQQSGDAEGAKKASTEMHQLSVSLIDILLELDKLSK